LDTAPANAEPVPATRRLPQNVTVAAAGHAWLSPAIGRAPANFPRSRRHPSRFARITPFAATRHQRTASDISCNVDARKPLRIMQLHAISVHVGEGFVIFQWRRSQWVAKRGVRGTHALGQRASR
jgi:hypothetical protein